MISSAVSTTSCSQCWPRQGSGVALFTATAYPGGVSPRNVGSIQERARLTLQAYPIGVYCSQDGTRRGYPSREGYPMTANEYQVTGMTCGHCEVSVREEVGEIAGVTGIEVSAQTGRLVVTTSGDLDDAKVLAAVEEAGYSAVRA